MQRREHHGHYWLEEAQWEGARPVPISHWCAENLPVMRIMPFLFMLKELYSLL